MHLPDGSLSLPMAAGTTVLAATGLGIAVSCMRRSSSKPEWTLSSLAAVFLLSAQSLQFPVSIGISGHMIGGVLTAIMLGPVTATLVMAAVLGVKCFLFHDGGITALGANIFNMAFVGVWSGWITYHLCGGSKRPAMAAAAAGWMAIMMSALFCSLEVLLSSSAPIAAALSLLGVHAKIGLFEAGLTCLVLKLLSQRPPAMVTPEISPSQKKLAAATVLTALAIPFACPWPDGLESVLHLFTFNARPNAAFPWLSWGIAHATTSTYLFLIAAGTIPALASAKWSRSARGR